MARSAATIQSQIDALYAKLDGIQRVRSGDNEVTKFDPSSILNAIKALEDELAALDTPRARSLRFKTSKGL
jgi:hypothetical protein